VLPMNDVVRRLNVAVLLVLALFALSLPAESARQAQPGPGQPGRPSAPLAQAAVPAPRGAVSSLPPEAADQTRKALHKVLSYYSPNLSRILALDPLLLQNGAYLEPYPELVVFLGQHPEVTRNAAYYFSEYRSDYYTPPDRDTQIVRVWSRMFEGFFIFVGFGIVTGTLVWLVKTLVDYRRWYRLSKVQTEAHNKLLDRFTANEELLAYINTPSGKRFLESAPILLDAAASIASPLKRILWAVEIGVVLACGAGGILLARANIPADLAQPFSVAGIFVASIGVGFILAAVASFLISKRLGVLSAAASGTGRIDAPPAA
jgi:hypothetical protein